MVDKNQQTMNRELPSPVPLSLDVFPIFSTDLYTRARRSQPNETFRGRVSSTHEKESWPIGTLPDREVPVVLRFYSFLVLCLVLSSINISIFLRSQLISINKSCPRSLTLHGCVFQWVSKSPYESLLMYQIPEKVEGDYVKRN